MVGEKIQGQAQGMLQGAATVTQDLTARVTEGKPVYQTVQESWERAKARRRSLINM